MNIPDKIPYNKSEKIFEAVSFILLILTLSMQIFSMINQNPSIIIMILSSLLIYSAFTIVSVFPQWTNLIKNEKDCNENNFHYIRKSCIIAKCVFIICITILNFLN